MRKALQTGALAGLAFALPAAASADSNPYQLGNPFEVAQSSPTVQQQRGQQQAPPILAPEPQRWSIALGGLYTEREGETAGWLPNVEANYAATDRLQLHAMLPYSFDRLSGGPTHWGIGDFETGVRYRFIDDDPNGITPAIAAYPLVDFPSGNKNENISAPAACTRSCRCGSARASADWIPLCRRRLLDQSGHQQQELDLLRRGRREDDQSDAVLDRRDLQRDVEQGRHPRPDRPRFRCAHQFRQQQSLCADARARHRENTRETNRFTGFAAYVYTF